MSKSLEDFLKTYIKNREIKNSALSYRDYVKSKGNKYNADYKSERLSAALNYKSALPTRGAALESLKSTGLASSGYAEHLMTEADKRYRSELDSIEKKRANEEAAAKSGYLNYLSEYDATQNKLSASVTETLIKNGAIL